MNACVRGRALLFEHGSGCLQGRVATDVCSQQRHLVPGVAEQPAFDHTVRAASANGKRGKGQSRRATRTFLKSRGLPSPRLRSRPWRSHHRGPKVAHGLGQSPKYQRRFNPFGAQAAQHAQRSLRVTGQHRFPELENVEARTVRHTRQNRLGCDLTWLGNQSKLLELLVSGQQISLGTLGQ
jgi:hypothetical protein